MSENITHLPEKVEVMAGDALNARLKAQALFVGLGPPDLCVVTKDYTPAKLMLTAKPQRFTYYHWVLGMDSSSAYQITNYFDALGAAQEKKGVARGTYSITALHYVSYNAFKKMDLHVEVTKPDNAVTVYAIDGSGGRHEVDDALWRQTYLCQMLRYINGPIRETRPLRMFHTLTEKAGEESRFMTMCAEFFQEARTALVPNRPPRHTSDKDEDKTTEHNLDVSNNLLTTTVCYYYIRHHRYEPLISFLTNWRESEPAVAVPIASALLLDGDIEKARALLESAMVAGGEDPSLMLALVELTLKEVQGMPPTSASREERLEAALKLALTSVEAEQSSSRGWWGLARVLVEMGRFEWALAAMNHAPELIDQERVHKTAMMDHIGLPQFSRMTTPGQVPCDVLVEMQEEYRDFTQQTGEQGLRLLSAASLSGDGKTTYDLLSDVVSRVGWESLVRARERVLVKPAELERERARSEKLSSAEVERHMEAASIAANLTTESMTLDGEPTSPKPRPNLSAIDDLHNKGIQNSPGLPRLPNRPRRESVNEQGERKKASKLKAAGSETKVEPEVAFETETQKTETEKTETEAEAEAAVKSEADVSEQAETDVVESESNTDQESESETKISEPSIQVERVDEQTETDESSASSLSATPTTPAQVASPISERLSLEEDVASISNFEDVSLSPAHLREIQLANSPAPTRTPPPTPADATASSEAGPSMSSSEGVVATQYNEMSTQTEPDVIDLELGAFLLHHRRQSRTYVTPPFTMEVYADSGAILDVPITNISSVVDLAFHGLFQDIKAFHMWKEEEKAKTSETETVAVSHTAAKLNPERAVADWVRLAMVANRLKFRDDAEKLYLLAGAYPIAWLGLLNLYAARGDIRNTIVTASTVQKYYQDKYHITQTHPDVINAVLRVMSYYGLQKVRNVQAGVVDCHPVIPNILFDAVRWRSKGFDQ